MRSYWVDWSIDLATEHHTEPKTTADNVRKPVATTTTHIAVWFVFVTRRKKGRRIAAFEFQ